MIISLLLGCREAQVAVEKVKQVALAAKEQATREPISCDADVPDDAPKNCLTGTLRCGDIVDGTIVGGDEEWNDDFYASKFCFPAGDDRSGPERVYLFKAPANTDVTVRLQTDCVDLDLAAIAWTYEGTCPGVNHLVPECEGDAKPGDGKVRLNVFKERDYLIAVEGKRTQTGPYRLWVECHELGGRK